MTSQSPAQAGDQAQTAKYFTAWEAMSHLILVEGQSWSGKEKNCVYLNLGRGQAFANVSANSSIDFPDDSRALAVTDWDDDGRLDLVLKNRTGPRLRLLRNLDAGAGNFVAFDLVGVRCNRDAIGAQVAVDLGGRVLRKTLYAGDGYLAQSSKRLHFGLGDAQKIQSVVVRWPDGSRSEFTGLAVNARYRVVQGVAQPAVVAPRPAAALAAAAVAPLPGDASAAVRAPLVDKLPLAEWALPGFTAPARKMRDLAGQPVLVNLWATWCTNCTEELEQFRSQAAALQASGLRLVAMSTDDPADREAARARSAAFGLGADAGHLDAAAQQTLQILLQEVLGDAQEVALPTSLLFDAEGQLVQVYQGPVPVEQLLRDVAIVKAMDPRQRNTRELAGGWWTAQYRRDLAGLSRALTAAGNAALAGYFQSLAEQGAAAAPGR